MKPTHIVKLNPFTVPYYVSAESSGSGSTIQFALWELSEETIDELCKEFRDNVILKSKERYKEIR